MIIIVHSETNDANIQNNFGMSEYSYYFVLKEFWPVLERLGVVVRVGNPTHDVDPIFRSAQKHGLPCVFLSFAPPHQTPVDLACPTIPVFAWEFDKIPDETWFGERRNDWRYVLGNLGRAITHSNFAVETVRAAMGPDFPVVSIPAPVWDRFSVLSRRLRMRSDWRVVNFDLVGSIIDTRSADLFAYSPERAAQPRTEPWPHERPMRPISVQIPVDGVVYTSVFNPYDGRKNWFDMLSAFCWALRDMEDATLVLKTSHRDPGPIFAAIMENLYKLTPFKCRVLLVHAFLGDADYEKLVSATTYIVNTSHGEGQCLPLMEFMSCGRPAIAPRHSSMLDYVDETNAFLVSSSREPGYWPHDPRLAYRTFRYRINFESLVAAYRESYRVATEEPQRLAKMSERAAAALERHCSQEVVRDRLQAVLDSATAGSPLHVEEHAPALPDRPKRRVQVS